MFKPVNRHILIEKQEAKQERTSDLLLPEDYKPKQEQYSSYKVIDWSEDTRFPLTEGCHVVIDNKMIEEITVNKATYFIVQDNYIVGILNN
jgi:co-chaperonin GroES (HSP10)